MSFFILFLQKDIITYAASDNQSNQKFGEQTALDTINISIDKNEIIGLLGPNGAGKSTLMKSIVGALKVDQERSSLTG